MITKTETLIQAEKLTIGESKLRRPLRRRDPLTTSATSSVGSVGSVRNRLVRPSKRIKSSTTVLPSIGDVTSAKPR